jgi:hypothetical protein
MVNHLVQSDTFTMIELYVELKSRWNTPNLDCASDSRGHEILNAYVEPILSIIPDRNHLIPIEINRSQNKKNNIEDL